MNLLVFYHCCDAGSVSTIVINPICDSLTLNLHFIIKGKTSRGPEPKEKQMISNFAERRPK